MCRSHVASTAPHVPDRRTRDFGKLPLSCASLQRREQNTADDNISFAILPQIRANHRQVRALSARRGKSFRIVMPADFKGAHGLPVACLEPRPLPPLLLAI